MGLLSKKNKVSFDTRSIFNGHHKITYRGINATKCPFDYVMYQMLVWELKPDLVIEIGTNKGGTSLYLADLMNIIGKGEIHTLDIAQNQHDAILEKNSRIKIFRDGYQGYDTRLAEKFETVLVIDDGSHRYEDTIGAMKKFAPVVTEGSYMIIEDGIIDELKLKEDYNGGPLRAIHEFLPSHPEFEIDRKWCDLFGQNATFNVDGYLRKKSPGPGGEK